jgi:hypothetical protein
MEVGPPWAIITRSGALLSNGIAVSLREGAQGMVNEVWSVAGTLFHRGPPLQCSSTLNNGNPLLRSS